MKSIYKIVVFFAFLFMVGCKQEEAMPQKSEIVEFEFFNTKKETQEIMDRVDPQVRQEYQINGGDYILPLTYNTSGVFYNIDTYEELGLSIPQDFESLLKNAEIIEQSGTTPFSFMGKDHSSLHQQWYALLPTMNDYDAFIKASVAGDVSEYREELELLTQQFFQLSSYGQEDMLQTTNDQAVYDFAQGNSAMLIMGSWKIPWIKQINPDINFAMFPIPKLSLHKKYLYEGKYRTNADAYWSSQTNELLAEQVQKLLLTKDQDSFVDAIIRIFKESQ